MFCLTAQGIKMVGLPPSLFASFLFIKGSYVKASKLSAARCAGADILPLFPVSMKSLVRVDRKIIKG
jgi:hypothetical protein